MLLYKKVIKKIKLTKKKKKATDSWQKSNFTIYTVTTGLYPLLKLDFFFFYILSLPKVLRMTQVLIITVLLL